MEQYAKILSQGTSTFVSYSKLQLNAHTQNEKWSEPADKHNTSGQFDPRVHSLTGLNSVSLAGFPRSYNDRVLQAIKEQGDSLPFNLDYNSGNPLGMGEHSP